jgi:hypothetical protein
VKRFRDESLDGFITYGNSLGYCVLVGLFTGIFTGVFTFMLYGFIAPELLDGLRTETIVATENKMIQFNPNISDAELDMMINLQLKFQTPGWMMIGSIVAYTFYSLVIGLILSAFMKRLKPSPVHS